MPTEVIMTIAVERLTPHPLSREIYGDPFTSANFNDLVSSIRLHGVLEPVIVTPELVILSVHRRVAAAVTAGLLAVPARSVEGLNEQAQAELIVVLNQHRKRLTSIMVREALTLERVDQETPGSHLIGTNAGSAPATSGNKQQIKSTLAIRVGLKSRRMLEQATSVLRSGNDALIALMDERTVTAAYRKLHRRQNGISPFSTVIKPSDNWNFSPVHYERIDGTKDGGYIPGDIYANCFWYFVKPGDLVVDPMAGSGMARHVYDHRHEWMGTHAYDFRLRMFDLTPQADDIQEHDLLSSFPVNRPDYIVIDLPYLGMSKYAYSRKREDLANMEEQAYMASVNRIAQVCADAQTKGKLCTVVSPNYTDHKQLRVINMAERIRESWRSSGYRLYMETYASRRIQQRQDPTMAKINNVAKERRLPLTDIVLIMTFERSE